MANVWKIDYFGMMHFLSALMVIIAFLLFERMKTKTDENGSLNVRMGNEFPTDNRPERFNCVSTRNWVAEFRLSLCWKVMNKKGTKKIYGGESMLSEQLSLIICRAVLKVSLSLEIKATIKWNDLRLSFQLFFLCSLDGFGLFFPPYFFFWKSFRSSDYLCAVCLQFTNIIS